VKALHAKIGQLSMERFFIKRAWSHRRCERNGVIEKEGKLPITRQCEMLDGQCFY
jgi:hypothetical protein